MILPAGRAAVAAAILDGAGLDARPVERVLQPQFVEDARPGRQHVDPDTQRQQHRSGVDNRHVVAKAVQLVRRHQAAQARARNDHFHSHSPFFGRPDSTARSSIPILLSAINVSNKLH
jgi:hypothetical protein